MILGIPRPSRTFVALILTTVAVAIPCGAWFFAGRQQVEHAFAERSSAVLARAEREGIQLAERLAARLEVLRVTESRRPFYHYQNLFHDPQGASEGASVSVSPLAQGAVDPLVTAHFQVDEEGGLSLPTVNDEFPELGLDASDRQHCSLQWELAEVAQFCHAGVLEGLAAARGETEELRWSSISAAAWSQHRRANAIFADLKYGSVATGAPGDRSPVAAGSAVRVGVGDLRWHSLPVGETPALVALRPVRTPAGPWVQGFVVSLEAATAQLPASSIPIELGPIDLDPSPSRIAVAIEGTPWEFRLDVGPALAEAEAESAGIRERFLESFVLGSVGASLAGLLVVLLVHQSERLARQRSRFAAAAAHELRTPLAGMRLHAEMLAEGLGDPQRSRDYAHRIVREVERLGRVVTNVLGFTRLERGAFRVDPRPGDLAAAVRDVVDRRRPILERAGLKVRTAADRDLPPARFDADALEQILVNLLDNAEKHTRAAASRSVLVAVERGDDAVVLRVEDDGPGIPPGLRRDLFRPFARGELDPAAEGIGLGLALVRTLAEAQGARVTHRPAEGGGAGFLLRFQSAPLPAADAAGEPARAGR